MADRVSIRRRLGATTPSGTDLVKHEIAYVEGQETLYYRDDSDAYVAIAGSGTYMRRAQNLADLADASDARDNLGLGTAALVNTGTSSGNVPVLNGGGKLSTGVIPQIALSEVFPVADITARDALTVEMGDTAIVADATDDPAVDAGGATYIYDGTDWHRLIHPSGGVESFNGRSGVVDPEQDDYTWAQIDKTTSSLADITSRSHTLLSDIGTNTHAQIDTHIADGANPHDTSLEQARTQSNVLAGDVDFDGNAILNAIIDGGTF